LTFPDVLQSTAETVGFGVVRFAVVRFAVVGFAVVRFAVVGFAVVRFAVKGLSPNKEIEKLEKKPLVYMLGFFKPEFTKSINSWVVYNSKQLKKVSKK